MTEGQPQSREEAVDEAVEKISEMPPAWDENCPRCHVSLDEMEKLKERCLGYYADGTPRPTSVRSCALQRHLW